MGFTGFYWVRTAFFSVLFLKPTVSDEVVRLGKRFTGRDESNENEMKKETVMVKKKRTHEVGGGWNEKWPTRSGWPIDERRC